MNTTKTILSALIIGLLSFASSGCSESHAGNNAADAEPQPAASYKEGHGVQFTPTAREFVGLATTEVATHDFREAAGVTAVPVEALLRTVKGDFVYVANGEWFLRAPVKVGVRDATHVEITDGLYEGDTIVSGGVSALWLAELQAVNGGVGCADGH